MESKSAEEGGKGAIQFVAESAAAEIDDLAHNCSFVDDDLAAKRDVEILEGDGEHIRAVKGAESFGCGFGRAGVRDAGEIGSEIQHDQQVQPCAEFPDSDDCRDSRG